MQSKKITMQIKQNKGKPVKKYIFVARGPGEAGQAVALAKYFADKGKRVLFCFAKDINRFFLQTEKNIQTFLTPEPKALFKLAAKEKPQAILFFNSKMWANQMPAKPKELDKIKCYGVDSNWLFNNKKYSRYAFMDWLDKYFVLFPLKVFNLGLKQNKGNFEIAKEILKKIIPVGFIPSYKRSHLDTIVRTRDKAGIKKDEKFIFAYFSGYGAGHRVWALENLVEAVDLLVKNGKKIKVMYVGPIKDNAGKKIEGIAKIRRDWLLFQEKLPADKYFLTLSSADLVFQHQGMVTLAQAITANTPVIANVSALPNEALPKIHFWEVGPFERAGACLMFAKTDSPAKIAKGIDALLYNSRIIAKMKKAQKKVLVSGEAKIYQRMTRGNS